jgi:hypothetical protein
VPVFRRTYRSYDGHVWRFFRWWIVFEQEWRILANAKPFRYLTMLGLLHGLLRMLQVIAYDTIRQDVTNPLSTAIRTMEEMAVNERLFFDFIRMQSPLTFIIMLYAGSGLLCNDRRNNLTEVYFAKPLTWRDYVLGKVMTLLCAGLLVTAVPAVAMVAMHNMLMADMMVFQATWWWATSSVLFSLVVVVPAALTILASSAMVGSQRFATITLFMLLLASSAMAVLFANMLRDMRYFVISVPMSMNRLGIELFDVREWSFRLEWQPCLIVLSVLSVVSLIIVAWQSRRAEVAQ